MVTALEEARGRLALLRAAVSEADTERAGLLLDALDDDLRCVERQTVSRDLAYGWLDSGIESDEAARELREFAISLLFWIAQNGDLATFAREQIAERFREAA